MASSLKEETTKGVFWSSIERFGSQGIQFLVLLVMARLLTPEDYGLVGMVTVFIGLAQAFIDSGFSQALIRKTDRTDVDNSTVFYFNIVVSIVIYVILYFSAPLIASFYEMPALVPITRVVCLSIIINAFTVVQRAIFTAKVDFKTQAKATLAAVVISGIIGIYLAYSGAGAWSVVWQQLINLSINSLALWLYSSWRPIWAYSWKSFNELFAFGSKLLATSILNSLYNNLHTIVIGKLFSAHTLGIYSRSKQFADLPSGQFTSIFQRVTFPVLCQVKDDLIRLENIYRRMLRTSVYVVFPCMTGLAGIATPMIQITLGDKWIECAYLLQIICFGRMWLPVHAINLDILQVSGRSDLFLKLEIYKKILSVALLAISAPFGIVAMCYVNIFGSLASLYLNTIYTKKILGITYWSQLKDYMPVLGLSSAMFILLLVINYFIEMPIIAIIVDLIVGVAFYVGLSRLLRFSEFSELMSIIRKNK